MARVTIAKAYERVNATWPAEVPPLTADEAVAAARRLYRWAMGETWTGPVRVTSGNRASYIRYVDGARTLVVNPEQGWKTLVHNLSHDFYYRANPGAKPHSKDHASVERNMVAEVVRRGYLDGKLRREEKPEPPPDRNEARLARLAGIDSRIEAWERKGKRVETALKRLHTQRKALVRAIEKE